MDPAEAVPALQAHFAARTDHVVAVYLFGSVARKTALPDSDLDVAVLLDRPPPATLEGCLYDDEAVLEKQLRRPVQIVLLNEAPVDLVHRVLRDGILVCEHDRSARIAFEVRARNEYFDLLPFLRRYRRQA